MERVKGIEPSFQAWEAHVLPLNHTRMDDVSSVTNHPIPRKKGFFASRPPSEEP
jgi:hypothetical protein